jgi:carboxyl-terminal processing protease
MKQLISWRPPLWLVVILMSLTLLLGTGVGMGSTLALSQSTSGRLGASANGGCTESAEVCAKFDNFWKVWNIAEARFLDPTAIEPDDMIDGAINGMLDTLNDQGHTRYADAEQYKDEQEDLSGQFEGIGAYLNQQGDVPFIVAPIEGSPAEAAGVQAGDLILRIDGQSTEGLELEEIIQRVRGKPGTTVTLQLQHTGEEAPVDVTITRAAITVPAVTWRMLPSKVAHIKLSRFSENALTDLQAALSQAKEQGAERLILDLRNNPGGFVHQAISVTSQFLPEGQPVLRIRERDGKEEVYKSNESKPETKLPMVVLINTGSASASEIFAGALQDYGRATVIGLQTIGLGTVVTPVPLDDGSAVFLGTAEWLTPEGRKLRHEGVKPDITVGLPAGVQALTPTAAKKLTDAEILQTEDTQLQRALSVLGVNAVAEGPASIIAR